MNNHSNIKCIKTIKIKTCSPLFLFFYLFMLDISTEDSVHPRIFFSLRKTTRFEKLYSEYIHGGNEMKRIKQF